MGVGLDTRTDAANVTVNRGGGAEDQTKTNEVVTLLDDPTYSCVVVAAD